MERMKPGNRITLVVEDGRRDVAVGREWEFTLEDNLRHLPGRREVYRVVDGDGDSYLVKIYCHRDKAAHDAQEEWQWLGKLEDAGLPVPQSYGLARGESGAWAVVTEFVEDSGILGERLKRVEGSERFSIIEDLILLVRKTHAAGFFQEDMHLGNFLMGADGRIWIIDAASHRVFRSGAPEIGQACNLGLLRANVLWSDQEAVDRALRSHVQDDISGLAIEMSLKLQRRRLKKYREKCQRSCSEYERIRRPGAELVRQRRCDWAWLEELSAMDPEELEGRFEVLKKASRCLVVKGEIDGVEFVLKTHWQRPWRRWGRLSRARRSWMAGQSLRLLGLPTPEPFAFWERRGAGWLAYDGLLMAVDKGTPLQRWVREEHRSEVRDRVVGDAQRLFQAWGELKAAHGDTKASNFHVGDDGQLRVIDLDSFSWGGIRWRSKQRKDRERFARNAVKFSEGAWIFELAEVGGKSP